MTGRMDLLAYQWTARSIGARARKSRIRLSITHWTGGLTTANCISTLRARGLSIGCTIDHDATIREHADHAKVTTQHVAAIGKLSINDESIGTEVAHRGLVPAHPSQPRTPHDEVIHGRVWHTLDFTEAQLDAIVAHNIDLCERYGIPKQVPVGKDGQPWPTVLPKGWLATFEGCAGHLHFIPTLGKADPGLEPFRRMLAAGFAGVCIER